MNSGNKITLAENAFRELNEGEKYVPVLTDNQKPSEATPYAIILGFLLGAIFTVAALYMPLKVGQGVTSDTPIAAIAVGLAALLARKHALGENMLMQCTGSTGSMVNSGAIFVIPALFILNLPVTWLDILWTVIIGGFLGVFYAIILRDYFVVHMHGRYPFPGSVATTEVLVSGGSGGTSGLKTLISSAVFGGVLDFCTNTFAWWNAVFTTRFSSLGKMLANKYKVVFSMDVEAALIAIGYLTGFRYSLIIACGSFFGWLFIIPLLNYFAPGQTLPVGDISKTIAQMSPEEIFRNYVRFIGIGTLAMSGILGVIKMGKYIGIAFNEALAGVFGGRDNNGNKVRTERSLPMPVVFGGVTVCALAFMLIMNWQYTTNIGQAILLTVVMLIGSFLFSVVGTTSIAFTSSEPVSGLTLLTLVIGAEIMIQAGLAGTMGIAAVLMMCAVVCGCLFMTGCFVGDLKAAYWIGITPKKIQFWKLINIIVSACISAGVVLVLAKSYGFGEGGLVAPQGNAMAAVISPLMSGQEAPWTLYICGAILALLLNWLGIPALAFGLGLYVPLQLNTSLLLGGFLAYFISSRAKNSEVNKERHYRGVLISSGFIAGGSLMGVLSACLHVAGYDFVDYSWAQSFNPEMLSIIIAVVIAGYYLFDCLRRKQVVN